jgi:hypothetical protein
MKNIESEKNNGIEAAKNEENSGLQLINGGLAGAEAQLTDDECKRLGKSWFTLSAQAVELAHSELRSGKVGKAYQLALIGSIATDKSQLLSGKPTTISDKLITDKAKLIQILTATPKNEKSIDKQSKFQSVESAKKGAVIEILSKIPCGKRQNAKKA